MGHQGSSSTNGHQGDVPSYICDLHLNHVLVFHFLLTLWTVNNFFTEHTWYNFFFSFVHVYMCIYIYTSIYIHMINFNFKMDYLTYFYWYKMNSYKNIQVCWETPTKVCAYRLCRSHPKDNTMSLPLGLFYQLLTHCCPVPYGTIDAGQHWFR